MTKKIAVAKDGNCALLAVLQSVKEIHPNDPLVGVEGKYGHSDEKQLGQFGRKALATLLYHAMPIAAAVVQENNLVELQVSCDAASANPSANPSAKLNAETTLAGKQQLAKTQINEEIQKIRDNRATLQAPTGGKETAWYSKDDPDFNWYDRDVVDSEYFIPALTYTVNLLKDAFETSRFNGPVDGPVADTHFFYCCTTFAHLDPDKRTKETLQGKLHVNGQLNLKTLIDVNDVADYCRLLVHPDRYLQPEHPQILASLHKVQAHHSHSEPKKEDETYHQDAELVEAYKDNKPEEIRHCELVHDNNHFDRAVRHEQLPESVVSLKYIEPNDDRATFYKDDELTLADATKYHQKVVEDSGSSNHWVFSASTISAAETMLAWLQYMIDLAKQNGGTRPKGAVPAQLKDHFDAAGALIDDTKSALTAESGQQKPTIDVLMRTGILSLHPDRSVMCLPEPPDSKGQARNTDAKPKDPYATIAEQASALNNALYDGNKVIQRKKARADLRGHLATLCALKGKTECPTDAALAGATPPKDEEIGPIIRDKFNGKQTRNEGRLKDRQNWMKNASRAPDGRFFFSAKDSKLNVITATGRHTGRVVTITSSKDGNVTMQVGGDAGLTKPYDRFFVIAQAMHATMKAEHPNGYQPIITIDENSIQLAGKQASAEDKNACLEAFKAVFGVEHVKNLKHLEAALALSPPAAPPAAPTA